ncbi:HK97-gp10 family putative phage morphogenesis protein [Parageobacillus toebii]|jgi:HK97 gp10 family phage protein|uniref:HK97-gp10 family putative phage morphogenesis protein n=1 Tax=Parageobacillus toebii TaxID=153151 RepID=UPI0019686FF2|nr:HK97-gp10 family putative phage morphogenesis protein [Parageobacillus toebii]QSB48767.1 HK97 gp10 family phage protein [Parageobacillus toebii]
MANFEFEGIDELEQFFEKLAADIDKVDNQALKVGGEIIAKHQRENVNRSDKDQPHIQDNITVSKPKETDEGKFVTIGPNKKVDWRAKFLEYGTSKMPPYPFIEKGADEGEAEALEAMERIYLGAIRE